MNFLVFGGSGFIGSHLIINLRRLYSDSSIFNLDIVRNDHNGLCTYVYCDIRNTIELDIKVDENAMIFNLAAIHRTPGHPSNDYYNTNILGAENVCLFARSKNIETIIFTSSIAPYGASEELKTEKSLPMPNTPYGISKLIAEKIHEKWQIENKRRSLLILRPGVVFGKGENGNFTRLYLGLERGRFFYPGRKDTIKACIYVKDLIGFMVDKLMELKDGSYCEIFNCAYYPAFSIEQIVNEICSTIKVKKPKIIIPGILLKLFASLIGLLGGKKYGIHPDRVSKLMISTNISGEKLSKSGYIFKFGLGEGLIDWFNDNKQEILK